MLKSRAIQLFHKLSKNINPSEIKAILTDKERLFKIVNLSSAFKAHIDELKLMLKLLQDAASGNYKELPKKTFLSLAGLLAYILLPSDALPDFIPALGLLDDLMVYRYAMKYIREDLEKYRAFLESKKATTPPDLPNL